MKRKYALGAWLACVACGVEDIDDPNGGEAVEFRVDEAECLQPTAPTAGDPLVATLGPGDIVAFNGSWFAIPGAAPKVAQAIDNPNSVVSLSIGNVVRVVNGGASARFKAVAVRADLDLAVLTTAGTWAHWPHFQTLEECLEDVERELSDCIELTYDQACCQFWAEGYEALCANDPQFHVANNTGDIWADLCDIDLPGGGWSYGPREIEVGGLDCTFEGWADGAGASAAVDISNGFLTACTPSGTTPTGCTPF